MVEEDGRWWLRVKKGRGEPWDPDRKEQRWLGGSDAAFVLSLGLA